jgi:hypothetical protein
VLDIETKSINNRMERRLTFLSKKGSGCCTMATLS